jgi:hypothetical protein
MAYVWTWVNFIHDGIYEIEEFKKDVLITIVSAFMSLIMFIYFKIKYVDKNKNK